MKGLTTLIAPATMLALLSSASAAALDLPGIYGNETGCHAVKSGEYRDDHTLILRPHQIEMHEGFCDFTDSRPSQDGAVVVTASCAVEGEVEQRSFKISNPDPENDTVLLFLGDGTFWTEIALCS